MPIRKRNFASLPSPEVEIEDVDADDFDNDTEMEYPVDVRGTFDPANDPFPGSMYERMGAEDQEQAKPIAAHVVYTMGLRTPENMLLPHKMRVQDLLAQLRMPNNPADSVERRYRERIRSPLTALRGYCVNQCQSGHPSEVKSCAKLSCPLWPFRLGKNGMRGRT